MIKEDTLVIYTDGSVAHKTQQGGIGIRMIYIDSEGDDVAVDAHFAGYHNVNSGQIELIGCTKALEEAMRQNLTLSIQKVIILTDSKYIVNNYKAAMFQWSKNRWNRRTGRPVPDADLWKELVKQLKIYNKAHIYIEIEWVKGHAENEHNIAVDAMAKRASSLPLEKLPAKRPIGIFQPKNIISPAKMRIGCVKMEGQKISIQILSCRYLRIQKKWEYRYVVTSKNSPYKGLVDKIFSYVSLDVGKTYYVKVNSSTSNPMIEKEYWVIG